MTPKQPSAVRRGAGRAARDSEGRRRPGRRALREVLAGDGGHVPWRRARMLAGCGGSRPRRRTALSAASGLTERRWDYLPAAGWIPADVVRTAILICAQGGEHALLRAVWHAEGGRMDLFLLFMDRIWSKYVGSSNGSSSEQALPVEEAGSAELVPKIAPIQLGREYATLHRGNMKVIESAGGDLQQELCRFQVGFGVNSGDVQDHTQK